MLAKTESIEADAQDWLAQFEQALAGDDAALAACFTPTATGATWSRSPGTSAPSTARDAIARALKAHAARRAVRLPARSAAHRAAAGDARRHAARSRRSSASRPRRGAAAACCGCVPSDDGALKAWTLLTALDEIKGHEERVGRARPTGQSYSRDFRGPNWLDLRKAAAAYADRDPAVLVVGGGQAGLSIAARLTQLGVDTLIVDREARVGDNWRNRYHALTLHNQVQVNHLPYMPFPPNWPTYIPKDKLAGLVRDLCREHGAQLLDRHGVRGRQLRRDAKSRWTVTLRRADGTTRAMRPRHIVMATGVSGIPSMPGHPVAEGFRRHGAACRASTATARTGRASARW